MPQKKTHCLNNKPHLTRNIYEIKYNGYNRPTFIFLVNLIFVYTSRIAKSNYIPLKKVFELFATKPIDS